MKKNTAASLGKSLSPAGLRPRIGSPPNWRCAAAGSRRRAGSTLQQTSRRRRSAGWRIGFAGARYFANFPCRSYGRIRTSLSRIAIASSAGIADMVQNRWLAPHIISASIWCISVSQYFLDFFAGREHLESVRLGTLCGNGAAALTAEEVAPFLERTLKERLQKTRSPRRSGAGWGGACAAATITVCGIRCSRSPKRRCRGRRRRRSCSERSRARLRVTKEGGG